MPTLFDIETYCIAIAATIILFAAVLALLFWPGRKD